MVIKMMNKSDKEYTVQKIREQYTEKKHTELDALIELDKRVTRPANIFAYTVGTLSALVMGSGMSLIMTDIGSTIGIAAPMATGVIVGVIGLAMAMLNYPIFKRILSSRRKKYADRIFAVSDLVIGE